MKMLLVLCFLLSIVSVWGEGRFDTECDISLKRCFKYVSAPAPYFKAEQTCQEKGGHLASIENGFVGAGIGESASLIFSSSDFWIGANFIFNNRWSWTDGTEFSYANWAPGQSSPNRAAAVQLKNSLWVDSDPNNAKSFVCEISIQGTQSPPMCPKKLPRCDSGWALFNETNACYKQFFNATFALAEATCVQHGAHLTSIHTHEENDFVAEIGSSGEPGVGGMNQTWIRMYRDVSWYWTDGTDNDFKIWGGGMGGAHNPDSCNCVTLATNGYAGLGPSLWYRKWDNVLCSYPTMRNFVCKKAAI